MDSLDGIELAAALRKLGDGTAIIFISSNREMALWGYEVSTARYLAKPLQRPQLREARLPECQFIFCHRSYLVNLEHIAYIRSRELFSLGMDFMRSKIWRTSLSIIPSRIWAV